MRKQEDLVGINRNIIPSRLRAAKEKLLTGPARYSMDSLTEENIWAWVSHTVGTLFAKPHPYPHYSASNGVFKMPQPAGQEVNIALLADWASDTIESRKIAAQAAGVEYSIHLGDTYYVGNAAEIDANFSRANAIWPYGTTGSFALPGNHEMYSGGKSYFLGLLKAMGHYDDQNNVTQQQEASYFCLENDFWRIIGLDTGYDSIKNLSPNEQLKLQEEQVNWLTEILKPEDKRGIIILSHHQCFSAFEDEFPCPLEQISKILPPDRNVIWLWGHEHWFSVYGPNKMKNNGAIYARCIGNSGMPVELKRKDNPKLPKSTWFKDDVNKKLVLYDNRERKPALKKGITVGHNGFAVLSLKNDTLAIYYKDDNDFKPDARTILEEHWKIDMATGRLYGTGITDHTTGTPSLWLFSERTNDAIAPL